MTRLPTPGERIVFVARIATGAIVAGGGAWVLHSMFAGVVSAFAAIGRIP